MRGRAAWVRSGVCGLESLEGRRLLSTTFENGVLTIEGTDQADTIELALSAEGTSLVVTLNGKAQPAVLIRRIDGVRVNGGAGNDRITSELPANTAFWIELFGGDGRDTLIGGPADENLHGQGGNDYLDGNGGNDWLWGGEGDDVVKGNEGDDSLRGGAGNDSIWGQAGDDWVTGDSGNDLINGGIGDDSLLGGWGSDSIDGESGHDWLKGGRAGDLLIGGAGDDTIDGQGGNDSVAGGLGRDSLTGGAGRDQMQGGYGDDRLLGGDQSDTLWGNEGLDAINGQKGWDLIYAQEGEDRIHYSRYDRTRREQRTNPLKKLDDPESLKQWIVDRAVEQWKWAFGQPGWEWGWGWGGPWYDARGEVYATSDAAGAPAARDHSNTNVQEQGVDEADLVKTDGQYLYMLRGNELVIVDAWPAMSAKIVSRTSLGDGWASGIYLSGDRLTVLSGGGGYRLMDRFGEYDWRSRVTMTVYDVADRASPRVIEQTSMDGWLQDSRQIGSRLYLVVNTGMNFPAPLRIEKADAPTEENPDQPVKGQAAARILPTYPRRYAGWVYEDEAAYRQRLEGMSLEQLLPGYTTAAGGHQAAGSLATAGNLYVPEDDGGYQSAMFSVVMFDLADGDSGPDASTSVVGVDGQVYASTQSLYVTSTRYHGPMGTWTGEPVTDIYKFALGADSVPLDAVGEVPGWVLNSFSMDEHGTEFRIATTSSNANGQANNVFVLKESGDDLNIVGGITELAFSERIYAARFMDDRAFLVTFRQTDPLYAIDLSDGENPTVEGELKIPGYSSYLHPVGDDLLIGVGRDADLDGRVKGIQVSLFNVADLKKPVRLATYSPEVNGASWGQWSAAEWDHHAFSYFQEQGILALPVQTWGYYNGSEWIGGESRLEVIKVDARTGFTRLGQVNHRGQPLRSLRIEGLLYSIGEDAVRIVELSNPGVLVSSVLLPAARELVWLSAENARD